MVGAEADINLFPPKDVLYALQNVPHPDNYANSTAIACCFVVCVSGLARTQGMASLIRDLKA